MKRKHHELNAWQEAMRLAKDIYELTSTFPKEETYSLTSQMRRAAVSIPSNIAEGAARTSNKEFLHFLSIARGSLSELETQVILSQDVGYDTRVINVLPRIEATFGLLGGLIKSIHKRI